MTHQMLPRRESAPVRFRSAWTRYRMSRRLESSSRMPWRTRSAERGRIADDRKDAGASEATDMDAENTTVPLGARSGGRSARGSFRVGRRPRGPAFERLWHDWRAMPNRPLDPLGDIARRVYRGLARIDPLAFGPPPQRPRGSRPRVGLVGFYGHGNYGDELFREVFCEHLGESVELRTVLDAGPRGIADRLGGRVRASDAILIGGGDILNPWSMATPYWVRSYLRRPVFIAGVGVPTW